MATTYRQKCSKVTKGLENGAMRINDRRGQRSEREMSPGMECRSAGIEEEVARQSQYYLNVKQAYSWIVEHFQLQFDFYAKVLILIA